MPSYSISFLGFHAMFVKGKKEEKKKSTPTPESSELSRWQNAKVKPVMMAKEIEI